MKADFIKTKEELASTSQAIKEDFTKTSKKIKHDFSKSSHAAITEMNKLLEQQKNQVESFRSIKNDFQQQSQSQKEQMASIKRDTQQQSQLQEEQLASIKTSQEDKQRDTHKQIEQLSENVAFNFLKDRAFHNQKNIVITGLREHEVHSSYSVAMKFFRSQLKLRRLEVKLAYRIGHPPQTKVTIPALWPSNFTGYQIVIWFGKGAMIFLNQKTTKG